jgi:hypothetical protein
MVTQTMRPRPSVKDVVMRKKRQLPAALVGLGEAEDAFPRVAALAEQDVKVASAVEFG